MATSTNDMHSSWQTFLGGVCGDALFLSSRGVAVNVGYSTTNPEKGQPQVKLLEYGGITKSRKNENPI